MYVYKYIFKFILIITNGTGAPIFDKDPTDLTEDIDILEVFYKFYYLFFLFDIYENDMF